MNWIELTHTCGEHFWINLDQVAGIWLRISHQPGREIWYWEFFSNEKKHLAYLGDFNSADEAKEFLKEIIHDGAARTVRRGE